MGVDFDRHSRQSSRECRARSDFTYVQSDLALHSPQNKCIFMDTRIKVQVYTYSLEKKIDTATKPKISRKDQT